jgi:hypothetical protein
MPLVLCEPSVRNIAVPYLQKAAQLVISKQRSWTLINLLWDEDGNMAKSGFLL